MGVFEHITMQRLRQHYLYESYRGSCRVSSLPDSSRPVEKSTHVCIASLAAVINGKRFTYSPDVHIPAPPHS